MCDGLFIRDTIIKALNARVFNRGYAFKISHRTRTGLSDIFIKLITFQI